MSHRFILLGAFVFALGACDSGPEALPVPTINDPPRETTVSEAADEQANDISPRTDDLPNPPPPPPPPAPSFRDSVRDEVERMPAGEGVLIASASGPREALFLHVVGEFRAREDLRTRPLCLRQTDSAMVDVVSARFDNIHPGEACAWDGPGVVLTATGESAAWVHAAVDCEGRACSAEGGATYGNLGAEGYGYRLLRTREGWTVEKLGIMWIS